VYLYCVQWENGHGMQAGEHTGARRWTVNLYCVQRENGYGMQAGEHAGARSWTMKLPNSGAVLNGAPQFVGRPEGELQWQADVGRVRPNRSSIFSACQVCGRSRADLLLERQSAALFPSCGRDPSLSLAKTLATMQRWCRAPPIGIWFWTGIWTTSTANSPLGVEEERFHNCFFDAGTRKLESC
jgi:hypothetical protein